MKILGLYETNPTQRTRNSINRGSRSLLRQLAAIARDQNPANPRRQVKYDLTMAASLAIDRARQGSAALPEEVCVGFNHEPDGFVPVSRKAWPLDAFGEQVFDAVGRELTFHLLPNGKIARSMFESDGHREATHLAEVRVVKPAELAEERPEIREYVLRELGVFGLSGTDAGE